MHAASGRREPKRFEPPPWERSQFDELAKRRAEEEARQAEEAESAAQAAREPAEVEQTQPAAEDERPVVAAQEEEAPAAVDPVQLEAMMSQLQAEEAPVSRGLWHAGIAAAAFLLVLGAVIMVWGIVALRATSGAGPTGTMGAAILLFFGMAFIAMAVWTAIRSLRQRGAL